MMRVCFHNSLPLEGKVAPQASDEVVSSPINPNLLKLILCDVLLKNFCKKFLGRVWAEPT